MVAIGNMDACSDFSKKRMLGFFHVSEESREMRKLRAVCISKFNSTNSLEHHGGFLERFELMPTELP